MGNVSSTKTEKRAINKIEEKIDSLEYLDHHLKDGDKGISWDGYISLYHGNIDDKSNWDGDVFVQVKGRTAHIKKLTDKWNFDIERADLENYIKIDGTLFLGVRFLQNGDSKIYYNALLPKNIFDLLKVYGSNVSKIKIKLKEVKDAQHLEKICREFWIDKEMQKKLPRNIFDNNALSLSDNRMARFSTWSKGQPNPLEVLGEEKFIYYIDDKNKVIDVEYVTITEVMENKKIVIKTKNHEIYYTNVSITTELSGTHKFDFGKAFCLIENSKIFRMKLAGTLNERLKQLEFICNIVQDGGFYINNSFLKLNSSNDNIKNFENIKKAYTKIKDFCINHKINKDLNMDLWEDKDVNKFLIWINAIDYKRKIHIKEFDKNTYGSVQIKDIRFSFFAEKIEDDVFRVYSIWNDNDKNHFQFTYGDGDDAVSTKNFFSIINEETYIADDLDVEEMKNVYNTYSLEKGEETLINLQVLELIKAYDTNKNIELLNYAKYLLKKIINVEDMEDVARINYLQIEKRLRDLTDEEIKELIQIRERNEHNLFKISTNLLIGSKKEAHIILGTLTQAEREAFLEFPIAKFLE